MRDNIRVMLVGDAVGVPGRALCHKLIPRLRETHQLDGVIVNGENSASDGRGITPAAAQFLLRECAVDVITGGNHSFAKREIQGFHAQEPRLLRPINFPSGCPGQGIGFYPIAGVPVAVISVQGRVFMRELLGCPFKAVESALVYARATTNCILVDMHAETTSEKAALAYYFDGKLSGVVGTHTHVQTADERVLPGGTAFISDLGAAHALNSLIGMKPGPIIHNMLTQMPSKFEVCLDPPYVFHAVIITIEKSTGKAVAIERLRLHEEQLDLAHPLLKDKVP